MTTLAEIVEAPQSLPFLREICPKLYWEVNSFPNEELEINQIEEYRALVKYLWYQDIVRTSHIGEIDISVWPRMVKHADNYNLPQLKKQCLYFIDSQKIDKELVLMANPKDRYTAVNNLYLNSRETDVVIANNNGLKIPVHSYILKYRSPIIYKALNSPMEEGINKRFVIDCSNIVLTSTISGIYYNGSLLNDSELDEYVIELFDISFKYEHYDICYECELHIEKFHHEITPEEKEKLIPVFKSMGRDVLIQNIA